MCGICGFVGRSPEVERMMPFLAWEMEGRGRDSWGVTSGLKVHKQMGSILDGFVLPEWGESLIYHTRAGSVGAKTLPNQHPFVFKKVNESGEYVSSIVGVHNGGISNHEELNKKYNRSFEVDSMHAFAHIAEGKDTSEIIGYGALAWFEALKGSTTPNIHFAKFNMHDFHVFKLECGSLVFCSLKGPIVAAAKMCKVGIGSEYVLRDGYMYSVEQKEGGEFVLMRDVKMEFGSRFKEFKSAWTGLENAEYEYRGAINWCRTCKSVYCKCSESSGSTENKHRPNSYYASVTITDPSKIGEYDRTAGVCCKCKTNKIDRSRMVVCGECVVRVTNSGDKYVYA